MAGQQIKELPEVTTTTTSDKVPFQKASNDQTSYATLENLIPDATIGPAKRTGGFAIGVIAGSTFGSTGNKTITGVGFTPKLVKFTLLPPSNSAISAGGYGAMTSTSQYSTAFAASSGNYSRASLVSACIFSLSSSSATALMRAAYVSMNSDGFTINVVSASSAFDVAYEAYG